LVFTYQKKKNLLFKPLKQQFYFEVQEIQTPDPSPQFNMGTSL